ncbi:VOC family protein [Chitinibacteraceae bacterium HSL-7]
MKTLTLCSPASLDDIYAAVKVQLDAPAHLGHNLDALFDALCNDIEGPYGISWPTLASDRVRLGERTTDVLLTLFEDVAAERSDVTLQLSDPAPATQGIHHVGLTTARLEETAAFFTRLLGWIEVRRKPDYPAIFVSDGHTMLTLWAAQSQTPMAFDRKRHVGLHHIALRLPSEEALNSVYRTLQDAGTPIEFAPELVGDGPAKHLMCTEPGGIRVELVWPGD